MDGEKLVKIILRNIRVIEEWGRREQTGSPDGNGPPPGRIRFKILEEEFSADRWNEILWKTAEWLINQKKLSVDNMPIRAGNKRYLVNTEAKHPTGRLFISPKELSSGLFIELNYSAERVVAMARKLLVCVGYDKGDLTILE